MNELFTILWIIWIVLFALIEGFALYFERKGYGSSWTLSEHFRNWFHVKSFVGRTVWWIVSALFFVWFIIHITASGLVPG